MAGPVEERDHLAELRNGDVCDVRTIHLVNVAVLVVVVVVGEESDQVLHAPQALGRGFLNRFLLVHFGEPHELHRHESFFFWGIKKQKRLEKY